MIGDLSLQAGQKIAASAPLEAAMACLSADASLPFLAVIEADGRFCGVLTPRDALAWRERSAARLSELPLSLALVVAPEATLGHALEVLWRTDATAVAVVAHGRYLGVLSYKALTTAYIEEERRSPAPEPEPKADSYVAYVAHDIRNPISFIAAACDLMAVKGILDPSVSTYLSMIRRATKQALRISGSLVQLERFGVTGMFAPANVKLSKFIQEVYEENVEAAKHQRIDLVLEGIDAGVGEEAGNWTARFDPELVRRIAQNLIDNACKHGARGGHVFISARCCPEGDAFELSVRNQGRGVPPEHIARLFQPFVRLHSRSPGHGLGLTIAKRFAELHGGSIRVVTDRDAGMTFTVSIPDAGVGQTTAYAAVEGGALPQ